MIQVKCRGYRNICAIQMKMWAGPAVNDVTRQSITLLQPELPNLVLPFMVLQWASAKGACMLADVRNHVQDLWVSHFGHAVKHFKDRKNPPDGWSVKKIRKENFHSFFYQTTWEAKAKMLWTVLAKWFQLYQGTYSCQLDGLISKPMCFINYVQHLFQFFDVKFHIPQLVFRRSG